MKCEKVLYLDTCIPPYFQGFPAGAGEVLAVPVDRHTTHNELRQRLYEEYNAGADGELEGFSEALDKLFLHVIKEGRMDEPFTAAAGVEPSADGDTVYAYFAAVYAKP